MVPRRVAFVDDNEAVRTALAHALGALPEIKLVATLEGPAGLEQLVSAAPELVLIDFHLLGVRGDTFAEVVKARLPAASIWLMTANRRGIEPPQAQRPYGCFADSGKGLWEEIIKRLTRSITLAQSPRLILQLLIAELLVIGLESIYLSCNAL